MILVCGEALIDFFPSNSADAVLDFSGRFGGSPFNVAFGIARLGVPSAFLSSLSTDFFGQALKSFLENEKVDLSFVRYSEQSTTLAFVKTGPDGSPNYAFLGENAADRLLTKDNLPPTLPDSITALSFGSFSLAVEPCGTAYEALMAREAGRRVVALDPNIRARLIADMTVYRERLRRMLNSAAIVKVSTEDLQALYGSRSPLEIAKEWSGFGPALIVVTDGPNGAHALIDGDWITFPGQAVDVIDTVGAGDTFQAAMLSGLYTRGLLTLANLKTLTRDQAAPVIEQAIKAAGLTCTRRGADLPHAADFGFA